LTEEKSQATRRGGGKSRLKLDEEYVILGELGKGGMAEVFKAEQSSLSRIVAIKKLKTTLGQNPEMLERFFREGKSAANLQHENIVQIYQMGEKDGEHYIIMEFVEGSDLKTILKKSGSIPWRIACLMMREVALGLGFAHQRGFIHRDIKPGNIMVSHRGEVKVMDFGIVRRIDSELTQTGSFLGTPSYMSPEQLKGEGISGRSDLFSLGVMFYEIMAGEKPFKADTEAALVNKILNEKERPVRKVNPLVPRRVARLLKRLLLKDPKKRFEDAGELARAIEHLLGEEYAAASGEEISYYLAELETAPEQDRTRKTSQPDSEPAKPVVVKRPRAAKAMKTSKTSTRRALIQDDSSENKWLIQTLILMAGTLGLILILYFLQAHDLLKYLLKIPEIFHH
jgi:eukaryotic-like serine/threonine-protein kinase